MISNILLLLALSASCCAAGDWPQFLGPARNNIAADDKALPDSFPSTGPKVIWQHDLGEGYAGPAVSGGKVIVSHRVGGDAVVEALDASTGKALWKFTHPTAFRDMFGRDNGPRATPTISGDHVFVHGADGVLSALSLNDGKLLWQHDTARELGSPDGFFGRACAPIVVGDKVIITPGAPGGKAVVAFNLKDGSIAWTAASDEASYASPVLASDKVLLCWLRNNLTSIDATSGKVLSTEHFRPDMEASVSAATPIKTDHGWFISAEYDVGASLWDVGEDGKLAKTWNGSDAISCHYATPVYANGHVFGFDGRQESGQTLRCWDTASHKVTWESQRTRGGTVMLVKDRLLVLTEEGELWIVKATAEKFDQIASAQILRAGRRGYPALSGGVLFARDAQKLIAVQLAP